MSSGGVYLDRRDKLGKEARIKAYNTAEKLASEVIDSRFVKFLDERSSEIISAHLYLEQGLSFTFLPLIIDL
jgi:hypothetical protein